MKLSIITINLNNRIGLQMTIDSIIAQSFHDFEWIVIDGASTDGSKELILENSNYISYWVSEPDTGIYNAMNKGIKVSRGEYLLFLNSGDYLISPTILSDVFKVDYDQDILYGNIVYIQSHERSLGPHSDFVTLIDLLSIGFCHPASFIKKELFTTIGLYDESLRIVSDWAFFVDAVLNQSSFKYLNKDITYFDQNGISNSPKFLDVQKKERFQVLSKRLPIAVINDYKTIFYENEVRKYRFSQRLFALLYRLVMLYEKIKIRNNHR